MLMAPLNVGKVQRKVCRIMSCLGIVDGETIHKKCNLVEVSPVDRNVRLHTKAAALPDINASGKFENVVDGTDSRRSEVLLPEFHYLQGSSVCHAANRLRSRHLSLVKSDGVGCPHTSIVARQGSSGLCKSWSRSRKSCHAQHAYPDLAAQDGKQSIPLPGEMSEDNGAVLVKIVLFHVE